MNNINEKLKNILEPIINNINYSSIQISKYLDKENPDDVIAYDKLTEFLVEYPEIFYDILYIFTKYGQFDMFDEDMSLHSDKFIECGIVIPDTNVMLNESLFTDIEDDIDDYDQRFTDNMNMLYFDKKQFHKILSNTIYEYSLCISLNINVDYDYKIISCGYGPSYDDPGDDGDMTSEFDWHISYVAFDEEGAGIDDKINLLKYPNKFKDLAKIIEQCLFNVPNFNIYKYEEDLNNQAFDYECR